MPITCYWGSLGAGKSYSMVSAALRRFQADACQIYTTQKTLRFPEQSYLHIEAIEQLAEIESGLLLLDEAQIGMASVHWQKLPPDALKALAQFRKNALDVLYTTQHPDRVNKVLRENTHTWVRCRNAGPLIVQTVKGDLSDKKGKVRVIPAKRAAVFGLYDTLEVLGSRTERRLPRSGALDAVRTARSGGTPRLDSPRPWDRPVWHVDSEGTQRLTDDAADTLADLHAAGRIAALEAPMLWREMVAQETRRRRWLRVFGLEPEDVPETCTIEHPWTAFGCPCHPTPPLPNPPPFSCSVRASGGVNPEALAKRVAKRGFTPSDARATIAHGGEWVADRLGMFQVQPK